MPVSAEATVTLVALLGMLGVLASDRYPPSGVLLAGLVGLVVIDVISPEQGFSGFANPAPLTVAALYVVAAGARRTGLLSGVAGKMLGGRTYRTSLLRLCLPTAGLSGLFNNTPLVAMLLPEVSSWARRHRLPISRYLMPLSFAAVLGGTLTLIGTSTSLVASGVLVQQGRQPLALFEQTPVAFPVAVLGLIVLIGFAVGLLPDRKDPSGQVVASLRDFALHLEVAPKGPLVGVSVFDAGLRSLTGVYLADIIRDERHIGPVSRDEVLHAGDLLVFVGDVSNVIDLRARPGLQAPDEQSAVLGQAREPLYFEAVIGRESPLVAKTLRQVGGRSGYRAAAVAIHRSGVQVGGKLGEVKLQAGDTLVLLASSDLRKARGAMQDFLVLAPIDDAEPVIGKGALQVAVAIGLFVLLAVSGLLSTFEAALVAAALVVGTRVLTFSEAKRAIDLDVVLMIAASLGIGTAVEASGLASDIAGGIIGVTGGIGTIGVVLGLLVTTSILTEIVTNNAAAAVVVPIAIRAAEQIDIDVRVMVVGVAVMASASFLTPIGYQTNAMVYGPGGYRFIDFTRVGGSLTLTVLAATSVMVLALG